MPKISFFNILSELGLGPSPKTLGRQLRKPSGFLARKVGNSMNRSNNSLYDFALELMNLKEGDEILEIGFGNGKMFPKLFSNTPEIRVTGLDYSAGMVTQARMHNASLIKAGKLSIHEGVSNQMPFAANSFDKVFCINVLYFWDNPEEHLREVLRVLKPGGTFYPVIRSKESILTMPFTQYGFLIKEESEWAELFKRVGFKHVRLEQFSEPQLIYNDRKLRLKSICIEGKKIV